MAKSIDGIIIRILRACFDWCFGNGAIRTDDNGRYQVTENGGINSDKRNKLNIKTILLPKGWSHQTPKTIVIHAMGENIIDDDGQVYSAVEWLRKIGLSAHRLVTLHDGIIKCREDNQGAWHAKGFNKDSLGIEFLAEGDHNISSLYKIMKTPYITDDQFEDGVTQIVEWVDLYDIDPLVDINEHRKIDPERKRDPGDGFPFTEMINEVIRRMA